MSRRKDKKEADKVAVPKAKKDKSKSPKEQLKERMAALLGTGSLEHSAMLEDSEVFRKSFIQTSIPMLNVALSGRLDGGLTSGVTVIAGASKSFKTMFSLIMAKAYMDKFPDAIMIMYDNEFGSPPAYLTTVGIDTSRVIHCPFTDIEQLRFDLIAKLDSIDRGEHVFFFIDSIGNAASKKEVEDAREESDKADMTRAKQMKSMFRMITPYFSIKDIPLVAVNHIYMTQEKFSKAVVSGGTGVMLSADTVWIVSKRQLEGDDKGTGYDFIITAEKSRFVKEKSKFPVTVSFDMGIDTWSGLFDLGRELGYITMPSNAWYSRTMLDKKTGELVPEDKKWRRDDTDCAEFWTELLASSDFYEGVRKHYSLRDDVSLVAADAKSILAIFEEKPVE